MTTNDEEYKKLQKLLKICVKEEIEIPIFKEKHKIIKTKSIDSILETDISFSELKGMYMLFNKDTDYYKFSGFVTAALLDYHDPEKKISILAIKTSDNWFTFHWMREDLRKMLENCLGIIGETEEQSFTIEKI